MSSAQWEVVTKSKKQRNLDKKVEQHVEKKRIEALGPKLEEILPSHKYHSIISGKKTESKENESPAKSNSSSKSKSPQKKAKVANKQQDVAKKDTHAIAKPPAKPKSLEVALRAITPDDFASQLAQLKMTFPGSELLWLKGVATYFSTNLPFDCDPIFSGKSVWYPSNLAAPGLVKSIVEFLKSMGETNLEYFYHSLMDSMATELSKNLPIVGYKFLLQLIGQHWPQICSNNMAKTALLRNSYQNRSNICLSILWAIGQGGYRQLMEGIKVWQNLMLPNLELKSYTKFVTEYMEKVLSSAANQSLTLNQNEFFATYNVLKASYAGLPREYQTSLNKSSEVFLQKYIASSTKHANLFLTLLREIENVSKNRIELDGCLACLNQGADDCLKVWKMNYKKQLLPSLLLLQKIESEISNAASNLAISATFQHFLRDAKILNMELDAAKKRDPNLDDLISIIENVADKSAQQKKQKQAEEKKKCGCCKWMLGSILLIALIAGALNYDTTVNGKGVFAKSATGKFLDNAGMLPYVEKGWYTTMSAGARGYKWAEKAVPPIAKPACQLACDLFKLARNAACNAFGVAREFVNAKLPVAAQFLEQYVPGLPLKIESAYEASKTLVIDLCGKTVEFFKTQVLVGRLSPENLSKTFNDTQNLALEYYTLFHKKVDTYAKLK